MIHTYLSFGFYFSRGLTSRRSAPAFNTGLVSTARAYSMCVTKNRVTGSHSDEKENHMNKQPMVTLTSQQARMTAHILAALALLSGLLTGHSFATDLYLGGEVEVLALAVDLIFGVALLFVLSIWYRYVRMESENTNNLAPVDINRLAGLPGLSGFAGFSIGLIWIMLYKGDSTDAALAATIAVLTMILMDAEINK